MATGDLESETTAEQAAQVGVRPPTSGGRQLAQNRLFTWTSCGFSQLRVAPELCCSALLHRNAGEQLNLGPGGEALPSAGKWLLLHPLRPARGYGFGGLWNAVRRATLLAGAVVSEPWSTE